MADTQAPAVDFVAAIQAAVQAVRDVEAERRADISDQLRAAAVAGDTEAMERLQEARDRLPARIRNARIALISVQIRAKEAERAADAAELPASQAEAARLLDERNAARARHEVAYGEADAARERVRYAGIEIGELRLRLDNLLGEASNERGPVVRMANPSR